MLLTVITSDKRQGMSRMLERELHDIEHEIIYNTWEKGLPQAKGNFVCLLEYNSAVKRGSIRDNLQVFTDNPSYRKLAMVSSAVDLAENSKIIPLMLGWTHNDWHDGLEVCLADSYNGIKSVRIGHAPGAVIRRSSLLKSGVSYKKNALFFSVELSIALWEKGLRISANPDSLYYAPEGVKYAKVKVAPHAPQAVIDIWQHEMIS